MSMRKTVLFQKGFFLLLFCVLRLYPLSPENEWDKHLNGSMMKGIRGTAGCTSSALMFQKIPTRNSLLAKTFSDVNSIQTAFHKRPTKRGSIPV